MWRCPKCFSEYFVPSVCNCGYDGRSEPNVTTRNAFDISLTVLGVAIVVTVLCLLWDRDHFNAASQSTHMVCDFHTGRCWRVMGLPKVQAKALGVTMVLAV